MKHLGNMKRLSKPVQLNMQNMNSKLHKVFSLGDNKYFANTLCGISPPPAGHVVHCYSLFYL